jgi:hypothetical protein
MVMKTFVARYYQDVYAKWGQPGEQYDRAFAEDFDSRVVYGNARKVAEKIVDIHSRTGCELMIFRPYWPGMSVDLAVEVVTRLGRDVLPLVREAIGDGCGLLPQVS